MITKKTPKKKIKEIDDDFFTELDAQKFKSGKEHGGGCVFLIFYFGLIYIVLVVALWQIGNVTHQTNRSLSDIYQAQDLQEIRDALAEKFGTYQKINIPSVEDVTSGIKDDVTDAVTNAVTEKIKEESSNLIPK